MECPLVCGSHQKQTSVSLHSSASGKTNNKRKWRSFVQYEFRPWTLNKLANTLHRCYEAVSAKCGQSEARGQSRGVRPDNSTLLCSRQIQILSWTYGSWLKQPTKTGEICHFLQDWTFSSAAAAVGCLLPSLSVCALGSHDISASLLVPSCICFLSFSPPHTIFPAPVTMVL